MTTEIFYPVEDTMIAYDSSGNNYGLNSLISTGRVLSGTEKFRSLIRFDISTLSDNIEILSAVLSLWAEAEDNSTPRDIKLHRALTPWYEGDKINSTPSPGVDASTGARRNNNGDITWGSAVIGGKSGSDYFANPSSKITWDGIGKWFNFDVRSDVQRFYLYTHGVGGYNNHGWWIINSDQDTDGSRKSFTSRHQSRIARLIITYSTGSTTVPMIGTLAAVSISSFSGEQSTTYPDIQVGAPMGYNPNSGFRMGFFKLLANNLPSNIYIINAILKLTCTYRADPSQAITIGFERRTIDWPIDITWNTYELSVSGGAILYNVGGVGNYDLNITEFVNSWYTGAYPNYGFEVKNQFSTWWSSHKTFSAPNCEVEYYTLLDPAYSYSKKIKIDDVWKDISLEKIQIGGAWKNISEGKILLNGGWKII